MRIVTKPAESEVCSSIIAKLPTPCKWKIGTTLSPKSAIAFFKRIALPNSDGRFPGFRVDMTEHPLPGSEFGDECYVHGEVCTDSH